MNSNLRASYNGDNCTVLQFFQYFYETFAIIALDTVKNDKYIIKVHIRDLRPFIKSDIPIPKSTLE